jgi:hypothetical protein
MDRSRHGSEKPILVSPSSAQGAVQRLLWDRGDYLTRSSKWFFAWFGQISDQGATNRRIYGSGVGIGYEGPHGGKPRKNIECLRRQKQTTWPGQRRLNTLIHDRRSEIPPR